MTYPLGTNFYGSTGNEVPVGEIISGASNIKAGANPAFTASDFYAIYPVFHQTIVSQALLDQLITKANAKVLEARWHTQWTMGMCNYIAHYLTLFINAQTDVSPQGIIASQSVGDVSVSYDTQSVLKDYDGYGSLKTTVYGQMFLDDAKWLGKGGMGIW